MTAAHCFTRRASQSYKIRAGEWDTQTTLEPYPHQERDVSEIIIHPGFIHKDKYNDIALLFLEKPVDITENVNVVCLPEADDDFVGSDCYSTGWGKDNFGNITMQL